MNWLDRMVEKNGDVILIGLIVIAAGALVGAFLCGYASVIP